MLVDSRDFGVDPRARHSSLAGLNLCFEQAGNGDEIRLQPGEYVCDGTVLIKDRRPLRAVGAGIGAAVLRWAGRSIPRWKPDTDYLEGDRVSNVGMLWRCVQPGRSMTWLQGEGPKHADADGICREIQCWWAPEGQDMVSDLLRIQGSQWLDLSGVELRGNPADEDETLRPRALLNLHMKTTLPGATPQPYRYAQSANRIHGCWMGGGWGSGMQSDYGVAIDFDGGYDANNSELKLDDLYITNCARAGIFISGTQAQANHFTRIVTTNCRAGISTRNGSFHLRGGNSINVLPRVGVCFELGAPNDRVIIQDVTSESSGRLLTTGIGWVGGGSPWGIRMSDVRFSVDGVADDGNFIVHTFRGPLQLEQVSTDAAAPPGTAPVGILCANNGDGRVSYRHSRFIHINGDGSPASAHSIIKVSGLPENISPIGIVESENVYFDNGAGQSRIRRKVGLLKFGPGESEKTWTFEVPVHGVWTLHDEPIWTVAPVIAQRHGESAQGIRVKEVHRSVTGFTVTLDGAPSGTDSLWLEWGFEWA